MAAQLDSLQKLPPQSVEMEQSVLGAILQDNHALVRVLEILQERDFYQDAHRWAREGLVDALCPMIYWPLTTPRGLRTDFATLVRGKDDYRHFDYEPMPRIDLGVEEVAAHKRITEEANKILYRGTDRVES